MNETTLSGLAAWAFNWCLKLYYVLVFANGDFDLITSEFLGYSLKKLEMCDEPWEKFYDCSNFCFYPIINPNGPDYLAGEYEPFE